MTGRCKRRASQRSSRYKCHSRIILSAVVEQFRDFSRLKSLTKQEFVFWCVVIQCLMRILEYLQINGGIRCAGESSESRGERGVLWAVSK